MPGMPAVTFGMGPSPDDLHTLLSSQGGLLGRRRQFGRFSGLPCVLVPRRTIDATGLIIRAASRPGYRATLPLSLLVDIHSGRRC